MLPLLLRETNTTPHQHTSRCHTVVERLSDAEARAAADDQQLLQLARAAISGVTSCSSSMDPDTECGPTSPLPSLLLLLLPLLLLLCHIWLCCCQLLRHLALQLLWCSTRPCCCCSPLLLALLLCHT
jgi:hypothetical protein